MNITINNRNLQYKTHFNSKRINITKEQILELRALGKTEKEIYQTLGIQMGTYYGKLKQLGLSTKQQDYNKMLNSIPKEEFETMIKNKVGIENICKHFNITSTAYYSLIERLNLRHLILGANAKAVSKEALQELIDKKTPINNICEKLNISKHQYFDLIKKFDINTDFRTGVKNKSKVTREQLEKLINNGKTHLQISKILNISESSVNMLITEFNIKTKMNKSKEIIESIKKEQLETLIAEGKKPKEICQKLNIPVRTYTRLINKFEIMTRNKKSKINLDNITKKELQELVNEGLSVDTICKRLKLSGPSVFYHLLKRLDVNYNYRHHIGEIIIPKTKLNEVVKNWTSRDDIQDQLNIASTTFYEKAKAARVTTVLGETIKKLKSINPNEVQEYLDKGATPDEICEIFNISKKSYNSLIQKYNLTSKAKREHIKGKQITKEQLENMINSGKGTMQICEELNITVNTFIKKLNKFGIKRNKE